ELGDQLRGLKERSGRTYDALARRTAVSSSTLHRYCSGSSVPARFAVVEEFARQCGASRAELMELHRWWALAYDRNGRADRSPAASRGPDVPTESGAAGAQPEPTGTDPVAVAESSADAGRAPAPLMPASDAPAPQVAGSRAVSLPYRKSRRPVLPYCKSRRPVVAAAAAAAVLLCLVLPPAEATFRRAGLDSRAAGTLGPCRPSTGVIVSDTSLGKRTWTTVFYCPNTA